MTSDKKNYEYERRGSLSNWLEEFANNELTKNADNPFEDIKNLFTRRDDANAVEARVQELRDQVGLDKIEKTASSNMNDAELIMRLIKAAEQLEADGDVDAAEQLDKKIAELSNLILDDMTPDREYSAEDKKKDKCEGKGVLETFPAIKTFIDNLCHARGGHLELPAILKMLRDERPEDVDTHDCDLKDYITEKLKGERKDVRDEGDDVAGMDYTVFVVTDDDDGNNQMFDVPTKI